MQQTNSSAASSPENSIPAPVAASPAITDGTMEQLRFDPYRYFRTLNPANMLRAVANDTPELRSLDDEVALAFLAIAIERICYFIEYRLDKDKTQYTVGFCFRNYSHWRTADWKLFFTYCCTARYGTLAAFDRENPQILFEWLRQYEAERQQVAETARVYFGSNQ